MKELSTDRNVFADHNNYRRKYLNSGVMRRKIYFIIKMNKFRVPSPSEMEDIPQTRNSNDNFQSEY